MWKKKDSYNPPELGAEGVDVTPGKSAFTKQ